ncbi:hypothetical protein C1646_753646 [Rhizophagus diaphanus]|nr:hypothetical protein C1646_753646 [Rhizophagus diaphanus] [Rhizophagus sp. MUCL 43196]
MRTEFSVKLQANLPTVSYRLRDKKDVSTEKKEDYQIVLCQDGKFAATLDTVEGSVEINKTIAYFKINYDFGIEELYDHNPPPFIDNNNVEKETKKMVLDGLLIYQIGTNKKKDDSGNYEREQLSKKIFKCPPSSNENERNCIVDILPENDNVTQPESRKGIAIYRIELNKSYVINAVTCYYSNRISGICNFIEVSSEENSNKDDLIKYDSHNSELRRFILKRYL